MFNFFKKKNKSKKPEASSNSKNMSQADIQSRIKTLADNFINRDNIEIIVNGGRQKISPLKWLYPGYGEYQAHAIMMAPHEKIATEIINDQDFVNNFLQNKKDIDGVFGYFVIRVEGNYVQMSDNGIKLFNVNESQLKDYDAVVLLKQASRLFPKFDTGTLKVDLKHIEVFGEVFNKLKSKLSHNMEELTKEQMKLLLLDIPTYTSSSIKIENSIDSYYIFKLAEILEKITKDIDSVTQKQAVSVLNSALQRIEQVRDVLYGGENSRRFLRTQENLEKVTEQLNELIRLYKQVG